LKNYCQLKEKNKLKNKAKLHKMINKNLENNEINF